MKVLYIATLSNTINAFLTRHILYLKENGFSVDIACKVDKEINSSLIDMGCKVYDVSFNRTPLSKKNIKAYKEVEQILEKGKYDIVHTHTPVASLITRLVSGHFPNVKVFYTAHGFHFHKGAPLKNWLIYYPLEKRLSKRTDTIITINSEDYNRARKKFKSANNIVYMPGVGVNESKISSEEVDKAQKRLEFHIEKESFVLVSVGEVNENKNHEVIIRALSLLNNNNIVYLICGNGSKLEKLQRLVNDLRLQNNVLFLGYREDIIDILKISDVFVFPSKREGLGMAAIEAMGNGLPLLCSNVHGINDYTFNYYNCLKFAPDNITGFSFGINYLYNHKELVERMGKRNQSYAKKYYWENVKPYLSYLYTDDTIK